MATPQRFFQEEGYYHVYNRGNRKQALFLEQNDYLRFLKRTKEYQKETGVKIVCYCLMSNHFHFLLKQSKSDHIFRFMLKLSTSYSKYFNIKYQEVGSLFQGRFKAKIVDYDEYLIYLTAYIHLNPAGRTIGELLNYPWSSLPVFTGDQSSDFCDPTEILKMFSQRNPQDDYKKFIEGQLKNKNFDNISHLLID